MHQILACKRLLGQHERLVHNMESHCNKEGRAMKQRDLGNLFSLKGVRDHRRWFLAILLTFDLRLEESIVTCEWLGLFRF